MPRNETVQRTCKIVFISSMFLALIILLTSFPFLVLSHQIIFHHPEHEHDYHYAAIRLTEPSEMEMFRLSILRPFLWNLPTVPDSEKDVPGYQLRMHHYHGKANSLQTEFEGLEILGQIGVLDGYYLIRWPKDAHMKEDFMHWLNEHQHVDWIAEQTPKWRFKRSLPTKTLEYIDGVITGLGIKDPGFNRQWHLVNRQNREADINVTDVWAQGITGKGVNVAVIDDGVDAFHEDLAGNFFEEGSYDFNAKTKLPLPRLRDDIHGTRCAGEIAAVPNSMCGVGIAYDAKVSGIRILGGPITDVDEAIALNYGYQQNHIYSCSWGPSDDGQHCEGPNDLVFNAMLKGIKYGRGGKGSIFVFATGNGGYFNDNCNYDGYTNSMYTISIGAIDQNNHHPTYSEQCSAHLAVSYSSGGAQAIYTTDVRPNNCTASHGGTSAAAPVAVGILALVLGIRPDLTWRDVQYLTIQGAVPFRLDDPDADWAPTMAGRMYSHKFAYGKLDAYKVVEAAQNWTLVNRETKIQSQSYDKPVMIPQNSAGLNVTTTITKEDISNAKLKRVEHVTVTLTIKHDNRGDLDIFLISPNNIVSYIGPRRAVDRSKNGYKNWTFLTVKHWEENPVGTWTLRIVDDVNPGARGELSNWHLTLYGESTDGTPVLQPVIPPTDTKPSGAIDSVKAWVSERKFIVSSFILVAIALCVIGIVLMVKSRRNHPSQVAIINETFDDDFDDNLPQTPVRNNNPFTSRGAYQPVSSSNRSGVDMSNIYPIGREPVRLDVDE